MYTRRNKVEGGLGGDTNEGRVEKIAEIGKKCKRTSKEEKYMKNRIETCLQRRNRYRK